MSNNSGQKFLSRNRSPRVQIEYDVEIYGSEKKVELPFVMGVLADLAGKSTQEQINLNEREFLEIDADNFNQRMKAIKPRVAFNVENTLTDEQSQLAVELEFEKMEDFSPDQVAQHIPALKTLLDARVELSNLLSYMDGKVEAEELISKVLSEPDLLKSLAKQTKLQPEHVEE